MSARSLLPLAVAAAALAFGGAGAGAADWTCGAKPGGGGHVKAVFGHTDTQADALALADRVRAAFGVVEVEQVGCADWQVVVVGVDTPEQQAAFVQEAVQTGWPGVSFQTTTDLTLPTAPMTLKAVFGTYTTAAAASKTVEQAAKVGYRLIGIARYGARVFKVVIPAIPLSKSRAFALQARTAGLSVLYELQ